MIFFGFLYKGMSDNILSSTQSVEFFDKQWVSL